MALVAAPPKIGAEQQTRDISKLCHHEFYNGPGIDFRTVEVEDRDGWRVDSEEVLDIAAGLASRRLGKLDVMLVVTRFK